jgi:hypothetical protein
MEGYSMTFEVDLGHYSLPCITEGPNRAIARRQPGERGKVRC